MNKHSLKRASAATLAALMLVGSSVGVEALAANSKNPKSQASSVSSNKNKTETNAKNSVSSVPAVFDAEKVALVAGSNATKAQLSSYISSIQKVIVAGTSYNNKATAIVKADGSINLSAKQGKKAVFAEDSVYSITIQAKKYAELSFCLTVGTDAETPDEPGTPVDPETPDEPETPTKPETPDEPETPAGPAFVDGTYTGTATVAEYDYPLTVTVTIADSAIQNIEVSADTTSKNQSFTTKAANGMVPQFQNKTYAEYQNGSYDAVSRATYSSNAITAAVKTALAKAVK